MTTGAKPSFNQLVVTATGVQPFDQRFPGKRRRGDFDRHHVPAPCAWRNNLTALSQVHNLYFVVYASDLYCYVPQYPTQALPSQPALIIKSTPSAPHLPGHLDATQPHAANNLVVQFLGTEEVVAVVRDDGDAEAFLIRHIVSAIERRQDPECELGLETDEVRPIFQENVGNSAWGLALHTSARIIAVSSNNHEVNVFKFGLLDEYEDDSGQNSGDEDDHDGGAALRERKTDTTLEILNGYSNIPHISFCNTGDDPEGRWLLTTDISGLCRVMDLKAADPFGVPCQTFRFGAGPLAEALGGYDSSNSGWGIFFLDRRSFVPEPTIEAALGIESNEKPPEDAQVWDITDSLAHVKDMSTSFVYRPPPRRQSQNPTDESNSPRQATLTDRLSEEDRLALIEELLDQYSDLDSLDPSSDEENPPNPHEAPTSPTTAPASPSPSTPSQPTRSHAPPRPNRSHPAPPKFVRPTQPLCADLPTPILHLSAHNAYLLQPSHQPTHQGPFNPPALQLQHPLRQTLPPPTTLLNLSHHQDRLNLHAHIPSLGIAIAGSQKGRLAILALTRVGETGLFAMRVHAVLPFASQEAEGSRPVGAGLLGLAVSPLQGAARAGRRWRLLVQFADFTVLSYEIARGGWEGGVVV
ncbi:hypothetical protein MBLNU230_g8620t1 [Neophaeotheca triangularis]